MTALAWDLAGDRRYETGVDRGVLYPPGGFAVAWNGLTSVTEQLGREVKSYFIDGIKYLDYQVIGAYQASLKAFTYPDALNAFMGISEYNFGVFAHDQPVSPFNLSYRTRISDDLDPDTHYRIHLLWNVIATPSNVQYDTKSESNTLTPMEWTLSGTPPEAVGIRPTSHISINTRGISTELLTILEGYIYGAEFQDPALPTPAELLTLVDEFYA